MRCVTGSSTSDATSQPEPAPAKPHNLISHPYDLPGRQDLKKEGGSYQDQLKGLEREKELLCDKVQSQDGHMNALKEQIIELSAVRERVTTEYLELRERLKRKKKIRRKAQKVAEGYSAQLEDGKQGPRRVSPLALSIDKTRRVPDPSSRESSQLKIGLIPESPRERAILRPRPATS
jgi:hypothetical protein